MSVCARRAAVMFRERQNKYESCTMKKVNNVLFYFFFLELRLLLLFLSFSDRKRKESSAVS